MLNIGRMGPGSQRYYLEHVAGHDDASSVRSRAGYYTDRGEAPGAWHGLGADEFGLRGEVAPTQLNHVLSGNHLKTGEQLAAHPARKLPGLDLTFRAPKSVSLLWALTDDPEIAAAVQDAHDTAVAEAVGYLERHAVRSRRGAGGTETVWVDGLIAAAFRHRTSRAGDPLLHTHVLAANLARTSDDGVWRTLDSRRLYAHAKTAGTIYQAALRHQLTRTLGVAWGPVTNGTADIDGVQRAWIDAFSKRPAAIVHELVRRGETSAAAAQVATLATRAAKPVQPTEHELRQGWAREATELGMPVGWARRLFDRKEWLEPDLQALADRMLGPNGVTEHAATFRPRDLVQTIAAAMPDGAPGELVEYLAEELLTRGARAGALIALSGDRPVAAVRSDVDVSDGRFTTRGLLLTEQAAIHRATDRRRTGAGVATTQAVARAIGRRPALSDEQAAMVRRLTTDGDGVSVVVGKAGTGKTYALDAAREAWQASEIRVTGVALAARASLELQESAGIPSTTLARLLHQLDDPSREGSPLRPGQVLVVDEAGMIGTRQLARLLHHTARPDVKTVLVGDPRQLPEIDAGGLFLALSRQLPAIELADNRRQRSAWEQAVLDDLRTGDVQAAVDEYQTRGRIVTADTAEAIREQLVSDWWDAAQQHPADGRAVMVALRRADVDDLNRRARQRMTGDGRLTGLPVDATGTDGLQVGDRIVCLRNDRSLDVVNGTRATVTAAAHDGGVPATRRPDIAPDSHQRPSPVDPVAAVTRRLQRDSTATPITDHLQAQLSLLEGRVARLREWLENPSVVTASDLHAEVSRLTSRRTWLRERIDEVEAALGSVGPALRPSARRRQHGGRERLATLHGELCGVDAQLANLRNRLGGAATQTQIQHTRDEFVEAVNHAAALRRQLRDLTSPKPWRIQPRAR